VPTLSALWSRSVKAKGLKAVQKNQKDYGGKDELSLERKAEGVIDSDIKGGDARKIRLTRRRVNRMRLTERSSEEGIELIPRVR